MKPSLLRSMTLKEWRTTVRERQQMLALAMSVLAMALAMAVPLTQLNRQIATAAVSAHLWSPTEIGILRWVAIGVGAAVGLFMTLGYLVSAIIVSFAGEKERKTLELTLVAPLSDGELFVSKCLGVLIPPALIAWCSVVVIAFIAKLIYGGPLAALPVYWPGYLLILSVPLFVLPAMLLVGLGAAISARAETTKGAGQVFGAVFMAMFFGGFYGVPLLTHLMGWNRQALSLAKAWLAWPFALQYAAIVCAFAVPAVLSLALGRAMFRRDRLLV